MSQAPSKPAPVIKILHLNEMGYGPNGSMTRRAWREACFENLFADKEPFEAWQKQMLAEHKGAEHVSFGLGLDDEERQNESWETFDTCTLDFAGYVFDEDLDARHFKFLLPCNFNSATFSGTAWFQSATFSGDAWFKSATFSGDAGFESATFSWITVFKSATFFSSEANFASATFSGSASFIDATFIRDVRFKNASFTGIAWFINTIFGGDAWFGKAEFKEDSLFHSAFFENKSDFENAVFEKVGHFEKARFTTLPPNFKGVKTDVTRLEFSDRRAHV